MASKILKSICPLLVVSTLPLSSCFPISQEHLTNSACLLSLSATQETPHSCNTTMIFSSLHTLSQVLLFLCFLPSFLKYQHINKNLITLIKLTELKSEETVRSPCLHRTDHKIHYSYLNYPLTVYITPTIILKVSILKNNIYPTAQKMSYSKVQ